MRGVGSWAAVVLLAAGGCTRDAFISGYDTLAVPGKAVALRAKLEHEGYLGIHPDAGGKPLVFSQGGQPLGKGITLDEGVATLMHLPRELGNHVITVGAAPEANMSVREGTLLLSVHRPADEFLVVGIDGVCSNSAGLTAMIKGPSDISPMPGAADALNQLTARYGILYVTFRPDDLLLDTKEWLRIHGFPPGPTYFSRPPWDGLSSGAFKERLLRELKAEWPGIVIGIGRDDSDSDAYRQNGLRALILEEDPEELGTDEEGVEHLATWAAIRNVIGSGR
jgi:hypothetical protein